MEGCPSLVTGRVWRERILHPPFAIVERLVVGEVALCATVHSHHGVGGHIGDVGSSQWW